MRSVGTATLERGPTPVDPRIAARRDAVVADQRRRRRRRLGILLGVVALVGAGWFATRTGLLDVEQVEVAGAGRTPVDEIRDASGVRPGDQLLDLDPGRIADAVGALPWVATVDVSRRLDGRVTITVSERDPVATVPDGTGGLALVDGEGRVLGPLPADLDAHRSGLVPIEGLDAPEPGATLEPVAAPALDVIARLSPGLRARVTTVALTPAGELELGLRPQGTVALGPPVELQRKLDSLVTVLAQVDQDGLASIDVRVPSLATVERW